MSPNTTNTNTSSTDAPDAAAERPDYQRLFGLAPEALRDPHRFFDEMREAAPVVHLLEVGMYAVTQYQTLREVVVRTDDFSSANVSGRAPKRIQERNRGPAALLGSDPPEHTAHRALVARAFTPKRMKEREESIARIATELIDGFVADGHIEFVSQYALFLPVYVIADAMGIPRTLWADFKKWSDAHVAAIGNPDMPDEQAEAVVAALEEFDDYFTADVKRKRTDPGDDVISDLVRRSDDAETLQMSQLLIVIGQLLTGGNETTTKAMTSAMEMLLADPALTARVRADTSLIPNVVEEALRYKGPVHGMFRTATRNTELGGVAIPAGSLIWLLFSSGSWDPAQFPDPHSFDIDRTNARTHLAFGSGPHHCVGSALARTEERIALEQLFARVGEIRLAAGKNTFDPARSFVLQGVDQLHLEFDPLP